MIRLFYIVFLLIKYLFLYVLWKLHLYKKSGPKFVKSFFEEAGGAFIKFGQILALRIDVLPKEYSLELIDLFDQYKPFSYWEVEQIFKKELGVAPDQIFHYFEKVPFASASFAQVHAAKMKDGKVVVVKIQRPGLTEAVATDFFIITILSFIADLFFKIEALPWVEFAKEFRIWTKKELDYYIEVENIQRIYNNTQIHKVTNVVIPQVYPRLSTKKILVQDYIDGIPLSRILREMRKGTLDANKLAKMGIDIKKIPRTMIRELIREYFIDGFFHADPHPGNILVLKNGKIGLIDFGIVGVAAPKRRDFMKFLLTMAQDKYDEGALHFFHFAGDNIQELIGSILPANVDQKRIDDFFWLLSKHFYNYTKQIEMQMKRDLEVMRIDYTVMILQTLRFVQRYEIKLPKEIIILLRGISIIGLLGKEMDYKFKAGIEVKEFFKEHSEEELPLIDTSVTPYKRMSKEEVTDRLNNWLAYLVEIDQKLYHLVNNYVSKYNK